MIESKSDYNSRKKQVIDSIKIELDSMGVIYEPPSYIYTLELEDGKYYVGFSDRILARLSMHFMSGGAAWVKKYKPVKILDIRRGSIELESLRTLEVMREFGVSNVRGGKWCELRDFTPAELLELNKRIRSLG
ncbi:GIY-YIG nuclease family protein [Vibrio hyugaensis]|uniref:GIY-YIG nuclease family protein n=1 Tax=Vibrio hyugaensis TaxID=1534743 RepID=UPI000CE39651|nr:GIY-YIG nuclease family protein [Vibrio hyugaensis]